MGSCSKDTASFAGKHIAIVGSGVSGQAVARLALALGARVRLVEKNPDAIEAGFRSFLEKRGAEITTGDHTAALFSDVDMVVKSPGVPLRPIATLVAEAALLREDKKILPVLGEMEFSLALTTEPIIAVTGTSGKTTTVSLIAAMLVEAGKKVFLGGNIGVPLSSYVLGIVAPEEAVMPFEAVDVLVLECSSFQLQNCPGLHPRVAVLLNLAENHLDQHASMEEYTEAKFSIFRQQTGKDLALLPPELLSEYERRGYKGRVTTFRATSRFSETQLVGNHNAANAEAAYLACREFDVSEKSAADAVARFEPLRHRLEVVGTVNGVTFVNDSKCTTVEALQAALKSFALPVYLLAGGKFKGGDLASLAPLVRERTKAVALYGSSEDIFRRAWGDAVSITWHPTMDEAFAFVQKTAEPAEVVLLSPATSSYDQFTNYIERGDHFCRLVRNLQ